MSFPEFSGMFLQTVQIEPRSGVDGYNNPTYGSAVSYTVRIAGKRRRIFSDAGDVVLSTHAVYFQDSPAIGAHDRLTLSTDDVNSTELGSLQPRILEVGRYPDDVGRVAVAVYF